MMTPADIMAPDETFSVAEAAEMLRKSERQVLRYLTFGALKGSRASGRWQVAALHIWQFQNIAEDMMAQWQAYCRANLAADNSERKQAPGPLGE